MKEINTIEDEVQANSSGPSLSNKKKFVLGGSVAAAVLAVSGYITAMYAHKEYNDHRLDSMSKECGASFVRTTEFENELTDSVRNGAFVPSKDCGSHFRLQRLQKEAISKCQLILSEQPADFSDSKKVEKMQEDIRDSLEYVPLFPATDQALFFACQPYTHLPEKNIDGSADPKVIDL